MVNNLDYSNFRVVVVSGPQRSGTTIAARIIASESGMQYVDEDEYGTKDVDAWKKLVSTGTGLVIHSPAMARWVHEVGGKEAGGDDVAVVWVMRPLPEVLASQKRIGWDDSAERGKYHMTTKDTRPVAFVKQWYWYTYQRPFIVHAFELQYYGLKHHPLWVEADKRVAFRKRQWEEDAKE